MKGRVNLTISELLKQAIAKDFKLVAGKSALDNNISGVNIMDNPEAFDWLRPGELIITSGYFFKGSSKKQQETFQKFKNLGIAGVCLKPDAYFKEVPIFLKNLCDTLEIPLIQIPYSTVFSDLLNVVIENLSNDFDIQKQLKIDTQATFLEASVTMSDLNELATLLETYINYPILIANSNGRVLGKSPKTKSVEDLFFTEKDENYDLTEIINNQTEHINKTSHPVFRTVTYKEITLNYCLYPILIKDINYGFLFIPLKEKEITNYDLVIISTAVMSIALEISHQFEKERSENKQKREFLITLLEETEALDIPMLLKKHQLSLEPNYQYKVINIQLDTRNHKNKHVDHNKILLELLAIFENHTKLLDSNCYCVKVGPAVILLYGLPNELALKRKEETEKRFIQELMEVADYRLQQPQLITFVGRWSTLSEIKTSYDDTLSLELISQTKNKTYYSYTDDYYYLFLSQQIEKREAVFFYEHYLDSLLAFDKENKSNLVETLQIYLEENRNITQSAKRLFIHRNTLLYRIDKVESLLGIDLSQSSNSKPLEMALTLYDLYNE